MTIEELIYDIDRLEAIYAGRTVVPEPYHQRSEDFRNQFQKLIEDYFIRIEDGDGLPTPREAHQSWCRAYLKMGWVHGPTRSRDAKTHPDLVPFEQLPPDEQEKDRIFLLTVEFVHKLYFG
jgi:hypothetical protein